MYSCFKRVTSPAYVLNSSKNSGSLLYSHSPFSPTVTLCITVHNISIILMYSLSTKHRYCTNFPSTDSIVPLRMCLWCFLSLHSALSI